MTAIAAILIFCLLIISHEFGHFAAAKACGVHVYSFNLGMGPKLWKWRRKETEYTVRLLPIGGSVQMMGEDEDVSEAGSFNVKPVWQRILIIAAGPILNFLTAIVLFIIIFMMMGTASSSNEVGAVIAGQAAEAAGIQSGDMIVEINGVPVANWNDISPAVATGQADQPLQVVLLREGREVTLIMTPYLDAESGRRLIGIQPAVETQNFFTAIKLGVLQSYEFTRELISALFQMVTGRMEVDVGGPVAVVDVIGQATTMGLQTLLLLTAYLSINLGVINLLPVPALDGCRIVFLVIEGLRGKPISREKEGMVHFVGLMLLFGLMILITYQDIMRLLQ